MRRCRQVGAGHRFVSLVCSGIRWGRSALSHSARFCASRKTLCKVIFGSSGSAGHPTSLTHFVLLSPSQLFPHVCPIPATAPAHSPSLSSSSSTALSTSRPAHLPFASYSFISSHPTRSSADLTAFIPPRVRADTAAIPGISRCNAFAAICVRCEICRVGCLVRDVGAGVGAEAVRYVSR
jgi:hypothetical protein